jgi:hypothetical protein
VDLLTQTRPRPTLLSLTPSPPTPTRRTITCDPVRILYTINNSPQYILAWTFDKLPTRYVPFQRPPTSHYPRPVNEPHDTVAGNSWNENGVKYTICPLRPCLDAICRFRYIHLFSLIYNAHRCFSPALLQDLTRGFSVYILDPLESVSSTPYPSSSSSSVQLPPDQQQQRPRGVAVGLGLMSWALLADEETSEVQVTGTVMTMGNGEEVLEVIFALREVGLVLFASWLFSVLLIACFLTSCISIHSSFPPTRPLCIVITHTPNADYHPIQTSHMQKASPSPTLKSWGLPPALVTALSKRSKQSSNSHKILVLNCLITTYSLSVQYLNGIKFRYYQVIIAGMLMSVCFLCISCVKVHGLIIYLHFQLHAHFLYRLQKSYCENGH